MATLTPPAAPGGGEFVSKDCFAWALAGVICSALAYAYRGHGWRCVVLLFFWLGCIIMVQMSVHWVLIDLGFPYPAYLTFLQFAVLCMFTLPFLGRARPGACDGEGRIPFLSARFLGFFARRILPIVVAHVLATVMNNLCLGIIDPGLNMVLGSLTPVATGLLAMLFGVRLSSRAWLAVGLSVFGGIVAIRGGADAAMADAKEQPALGIALSLANMFFTALKNVVIDRAIRGSARRTAGKGGAVEDPVVTPVQVVLIMTPVAALGLFPYAALHPVGLSTPTRAMGRGAAAMWQAATASAQPAVEAGAHPLLLPGLALAAASMASLTLSGICVVQQIGATAMQVVGKAQIFITLSISAAYVGETVTVGEVVGAVMIIAATSLFTSAPPARSTHETGTELMDKRGGELRASAA